MTGVTLSYFLDVSHTSKNAKPALSTQDVTLVYIPCQAQGLFQLCLSPPERTGCTVLVQQSNNSIFNFIPGVELPALFHSKILNLRFFQFLFHFRSVQVF